MVLLDIMLPDEDGLTILKKLRDNGPTRRLPVIMLPAKGTEYDKVVGLDGGADDYIPKPFGMMELVSRVRARLRRTEPEKRVDSCEAGAIRVDLNRHVVMVDGLIVNLTFKEFELLAYFMENQGIALSREKILNNVWNYDYFGDARTIDTHVKKLRSKMGEKGDYIKTIWGMGYKLDIDAPQ